jgi:flagellar M-ring protein FliF
VPQAIEQIIERVGGQRRAMMIGVGVVIAALIFGISQWATAPQWVPAFSDQPMEMVGQMTDKLQQANIPFKLDRGGSEILVNASDVARARVTLAKDGLPAAGRPGLELFDQPSWGMTDFTQRVNYRRALEGELERTIGKMRGIRAAQVHLALHEQSNFRQQNKPVNASVVLKTDGSQPPADVVQGIAHLVASSVDGLTSERVTVLDDSGRLLSLPADDGSFAALTSTQLSAQRDVESYLQTKAEGLLSDIVGAGNARVRVAAALNFDKIERQSQLVDPDKQATSTEQRYEITPGPQGGAASSNVATSYDNSRITESFSGATGNIKHLSVAVLVNDKEVPATKPGDKPTYVARTPEEIARIESLVRSAVGADSARGDLVTVVAARFDGASLLPAEPDAPDVWERVQQFQKPGITALGFVTLLIALVLVLRALKTNSAPPVPELALAAAGAPQVSALPPGESDVAFALERPISRPVEPLRFPQFSDNRNRVMATVAAKPEVAARVVRAWLKETK